MKSLLLTAAMAVSLAGGAVIAAPIHGIPPRGQHCWPTRFNHFCHHRTLGLVVRHPVHVKTIPQQGFTHGIQPERAEPHAVSRVAH